MGADFLELEIQRDEIFVGTLDIVLFGADQFIGFLAVIECYKYYFVMGHQK